MKIYVFKFSFRLYFSSGHIPRKLPELHRRNRSLALTYVTFSPDGTELLANLGGEQIYLFDVTTQRKPLKLQLPEKVRPAASNGLLSSGLHVRNGTSNGVTEAISQTLLAEEKKPKSHREKYPTPNTRRTAANGA